MSMLYMMGLKKGSHVNVNAHCVHPVDYLVMAADDATARDAASNRAATLHRAGVGPEQSGEW